MLVRSLCALVSLAVAIQAQSFTEGFEPGPATPGVAPVPTGWTSVNNSVGGPGTNPDWQVRNDGVVFAAFSGTTYAFANYNSSTGANDISNYLMSPLVTFNNGDTISFYTSTVGTPAFPDRMELVYNTTGSTNPVDFTNVLLTINPTLTLTGYPTTWTQFTATITGLGGATAGRFAFHYNPTNGGPAGSNSDYIGVDEVVFTGSGGGTLATNTTLGSGCGGSALGDGSAYELFDGATSNFDLSNTSITYNWTGSGYVLVGGTNPIVPPAGGALAMTDDSIATITLPFSFPCPSGDTNTLFLCSNGFLSFQAGAVATDYVETAAGFMSGTSRLAFLWDDLNPNSTGINAEAVGGDFVITFTNVPQFGGTDQNNCQIVLSPTGNIDVRYGACALLDCGTGVTTGNGATDPGSSDFSTALPIVITTGHVVPDLALTANTRPITGTNWNMTTSNIPAPGVTLEVYGLVDPNVPDLFFLGMPGCELRSSLDVIAGPTFGTPTAPRSLAIPNTPSLIGAEVFAQSACLAPSLNAFGFITSNGIKGTIGDV